MKKLSNTEAELKKRCLYKKECVYITVHFWPENYLERVISSKFFMKPVTREK